MSKQLNEITSYVVAQTLRPQQTAAIQDADKVSVRQGEAIQLALRKEVAIVTGGAAILNSPRQPEDEEMQDRHESCHITSCQ